jgi:hypothetical protein
MAIHDINRLARLITGGDLKPSQLTFAVELFGNIEDSKIAIKVLLPMLDHSLALVREGVIYGLSAHLNDKVRAKLLDISKNDKSSGVKEAARDVLS